MNNTNCGNRNLCYSKTHYPKIEKNVFFKNVIQKTKNLLFIFVLFKITHFSKKELKYYHLKILNKNKLKSN